MNLNDLFNEEKVRLDPKCWTGKKIGNPKTKMKGGTRVNNCVPAESVNEMDKSQTPPGRDGSNDSDAGKKEYTATSTTPGAVAKQGGDILNKAFKDSQRVNPRTGKKMNTKGVAEDAGETLQQQKIRAAISNGLAKSSQMGKTEYQSQPTNRTYFDNAGYASDKLTGIDSIDPDGTVVISIGDTRAADWVKKLAALGGMPGIKTREVQPKLAQGMAEATGDQKFDSMMGQITGGATARQSVDSLNKSLTARTGSNPETALAKWGQEFINWLEKICRNFERQGVDRFKKLEKVGNLDDGGETMAHWLIEVAKQSNTSGITQADIQEFSSEFNTHGMWAWHQFPIAWDLKEWQDYKDQWTGPDGYIANLGQGMTEEYELAGVGVAYELGRRAYKQGMTIRDNPYSATREARKYDEWAKGLERGKHDANDARHFRSSVREQGVAEAGDSNFVGFMNKTLADKVDAPKADPMAGAPDFYRNAAVSTLDARRGFKNALKFGLKALSRLDPETRQQLAAGSEQAVANYLTDVAQRSGQMGDGTFVEEDISEVQDYLSDVFHDPSINSWKDVLQQSRTMSESQLDEKSVSQAQFRTMAAAAHNPEFAKKVGIGQAVAKEFNQADKGSNYKKLPDRTTEGELDEGWKSALGAAAIAGTMAMGGGAHARVSGDYVDNPEINRLTGQPKVTQQISPDAAKPAVTKPGFSKEYLQSVVDGTHPRPLISKERAQELLQQQTTNEQGEQQKGADYRDPPEADYGDDYQDMVARVKKLAGLGPLKTVYDPTKRVYRNVPTAVQPKK